MACFRFIVFSRKEVQTEGRKLCRKSVYASGWRGDLSMKDNES
jgi:hypothetical protein